MTEFALAGTGITTASPVHANLTAASLVQHAMLRGEGRLSADGAFIGITGQHTGRSVADKFVVDEPETTADIWWGKVNKKLEAAKYEVFLKRVRGFLGSQTEVFTQDLYAGADPKYRIKVRLVTTNAWHALFARNMFIRPPEAELADFKPDYTILHAPELDSVPAEDGGREGSTTLIALSFKQRIIAIAGTSYAGE
ncbi:MAG: phosphoenolpyruvate carboxykinase, partial [Rubritepida sp.]|nr:phosphoenolpyruvate carboxykinase [Rubritepida sp.]